MKNSNELAWRVITSDYDTKDDPNIIKALCYLRKSQYRVSASGRGIHVRGWAYCTISDIIKIRRILGDDEGRLMYDEILGRPQGILWDEKVVNGVRYKAGKWIDYKKGDELQLGQVDLNCEFNVHQSGEFQ